LWGQTVRAAHKGKSAGMIHNCELIKFYTEMESNKETEKHLKRISNNLIFFFWLTITALTGTFLAVLMELQKVR
jgi:hypothetical protein